MKKSILIILLTVIINVPVSLLFADSDWEFWNHYKTNLNLKNNVAISMAPEFRFKESLNNYYNHIDIGLDWKISEWISVNASYRHIFKKQNNRWDQVYCPHINVKFIRGLNKYNLSNRSRIELRIINKDSSFRFRNKTTVRLPKLILLHIRPNLAEEIFYDFQTDRINKNRIYAGVEFPLGKKLGGVIYYILESSRKENYWQKINILKLDIKYDV